MRVTVNSLVLIAFFLADRFSSGYRNIEDYESSILTLWCILNLSIRRIEESIQSSQQISSLNNVVANLIIFSLHHLENNPFLYYWDKLKKNSSEFSFNLISFDSFQNIKMIRFASVVAMIASSCFFYGDSILNAMHKKTRLISISCSFLKGHYTYFHLGKLSCSHFFPLWDLKCLLFAYPLFILPMNLSFRLSIANSLDLWGLYKSVSKRMCSFSPDFTWS